MTPFQSVISKGHGIVEDVEADEGFHRNTGAEQSGNNDGKEINQDVLIGRDTAEHIHEAVLFLRAFLLHVFQLRIVLMDLKHHGEHEHQENQSADNADGAHGNAHLLAQKRGDDDGHAHGLLPWDSALSPDAAKLQNKYRKLVR